MESGTPNGNVYNIYKNTSDAWTLNSYANKVDTTLGEMSDVVKYDFSNISYIYYTLSNKGRISYMMITPTSISSNN